MSEQYSGSENFDKYSNFISPEVLELNNKIREFAWDTVCDSNLIDYVSLSSLLSESNLCLNAKLKMPSNVLGGEYWNVAIDINGRINKETSPSEKLTFTRLLPCQDKTWCTSLVEYTNFPGNVAIRERVWRNGNNPNATDCRYFVDAKFMQSLYNHISSGELVTANNAIKIEKTHQKAMANLFPILHRNGLN